MIWLSLNFDFLTAISFKAAEVSIFRLSTLQGSLRIHRRSFESLQHTSRIIGDWIGFYNHQRPHQALGMKTAAEAYALAA
jgi:transposase InsO family protein